MKKIAIIKKKEVLLGLLAIFFMLVGFFSYNPIIKKEYSRIADIQNYSESSLGEATLVSSNDVIEEDATTDTTTENPSEEIETSAAVKKYASDNNIELNREDYKIIKAKDKTFKNISITILKDNYVLLSKSANPIIHFVIRHPKLVNAIENFSPLVKDET